MPTEWFRLPETGSGETPQDAKRPAYVRSMGLSFSGNESYPDGAPFWIVKVKGTKSELDELASKPKAKRLSNIPKQALNNMFGQNRTEKEWEEAFEP